MTLTLIGLGNMGTSLLGALLLRGHHVLAVDRDPRKIGELAGGRSPVPEQGADQAIRAALAAGRLRTADAVPDLAASDTTLVAVQTPARGSACDYSALRAVLSEIAARAPQGHLAIVASTLFPGAIRGECLPALGPRAHFAYHPVFLRAQHGIEDYLSPGKLILGVADPAAPHPTLVRLFDSLTAARPRFVSYEEAEWIKVVHNAFMCLKVAFANEVGALCEHHRADGRRILRLTFDENPDGRLLTRSHLTPGPPYSGPCLPKDADVYQGLLASVERFDEWLSGGVGVALRESNLRHRQLLVRRWLEAGLATDRPLGIVGLSFRPGYNDLRGSLALDFVRAARAAGLEWLAYDPALTDLGREEYLLASRQDPELEALFERATRRLEEVWDRCCVVFVNRELSPPERELIARSSNRPRIIDVYHNGLPDADERPGEAPAARPLRKSPRALAAELEWALTT